MNIAIGFYIWLYSRECTVKKGVVLFCTYVLTLVVERALSFVLLHHHVSFEPSFSLETCPHFGPPPRLFCFRTSDISFTMKYRLITIWLSLHAYLSAAVPLDSRESHCGVDSCLCDDACRVHQETETCCLSQKGYSEHVCASGEWLPGWPSF